MIIPHKILFHGWPTAVILEKQCCSGGGNHYVFRSRRRREDGRGITDSWYLTGFFARIRFLKKVHHLSLPACSAIFVQLLMKLLINWGFISAFAWETGFGVHPVFSELQDKNRCGKRLKYVPFDTVCFTCSLSTYFAKGRERTSFVHLCPWLVIELYQSTKIFHLFHAFCHFLRLFFPCLFVAISNHTLLAPSIVHHNTFFMIGLLH